MLKINSFPSTFSSDIHFLSTLLQFSPQKFHVNAWQRAVRALTRRRWYTVISPQNWRGAEPLLVKSTNSSALGLAPQDVPSTRHRARTAQKLRPISQLAAWLPQLLSTCMKRSGSKENRDLWPPTRECGLSTCLVSPMFVRFCHLPSSSASSFFSLVLGSTPTQTNICSWLLLSELGWQACLFTYFFIYLLIYLFIGRLANGKKADKSTNVRATAFEFKAQSNYNKGFAWSEIKSLFKLQHRVTHSSYHWAMIKVNEIPNRLPLGHAHSKCIGFLLELKWNSYRIAALLDI